MSRDYWYFGYRDIDQKLRMVYVGPDNERGHALAERLGKDWERRATQGRDAMLRVAPELASSSLWQ